MLDLEKILDFKKCEFLGNSSHVLVSMSRKENSKKEI